MRVRNCNVTAKPLCLPDAQQGRMTGSNSFDGGVTVVGSTGIQAVKMSAAIACRGEFYRWKGREAERDDLLIRLASVIHEAPILKVAAPILAGEFESLPQFQRRKLKDPQYCGFESCVKGLIQNYPNDVFQINCDLTQDYAETCVSLFNHVVSRNAHLADRLIAIAFGNDKFIPQLQAADIIAYCARAMAEEKRFGVRAHPVVHAIDQMFSSRGTERTYLVYKAGGEGLGFAEAE